MRLSLHCWMAARNGPPFFVRGAQLEEQVGQFIQRIVRCFQRTIGRKESSAHEDSVFNAPAWPRSQEPNWRDLWFR